MVKLVHFQGYPATLLPVMVTHVPSMHICLKFIPELVTQPQTDKQVSVRLLSPSHPSLYLPSFHFVRL